MKSKLLFICVSLCALQLSFAQKETANWYFGNQAGIHFNDDGSVTALTDGALSTIEGCTSMSNADGNLLFYTDGINVYNRNHERMLNGSGLYGDPSSTQSAIIVPKPEDPNIYYIFTVDTKVEETDINHGFRYSMVDLSRNGGLGDVVTKNVKLLDKTTEKISAVIKDCSEQSVWIVTLANEDGSEGDMFNTYHAFEINTSGLITTPVTTTFESLWVSDFRGYLKFSPDGTKMASANVQDGLYLYDFDPLTGKLANQTRLRIDAGSNSPYGIEFSSNNRFLYTHTYNDGEYQYTGVNSSKLLQFDLEANDIEASAVLLDQRNGYRGALQLGINGKIYRTISESYEVGASYLGVIHNPNEKGTASDYEHNAVYLGGKQSYQGLPPFIQSFFNKVDIINNADGSTSREKIICANDTQLLEAPVLENATYFWEKDGVLLTANTATLTLANLQEENSGIYKVEILPADPNKCPIYGEATLNVNAIPDITHGTMIQCDDDENTTDGYSLFNLLHYVANDTEAAQEYTYTFYQDETNYLNGLPITSPERFANTTAFSQIIFVEVSNGPCSSSSKLELVVSPNDTNIATGISFFACDMDPTDTVLEGTIDFEGINTLYFSAFSTSFFNTSEEALLEINPIDITTYISTGETIYVRLENNEQCEGIIPISIVLQERPHPKLEASYMLCTDNPDLSITAEEGYDSYTWYQLQTDGSKTVIGNNREVSFTAAGSYELEVTTVYNALLDWSCSGSTVFEVIPSNKAVVSTITVEDLQEDNSIAIVATGDGDYEYAIQDENGPYQDSPLFEGVAPGIIPVFVRDKNGCGITEADVAVVGFPKFFSPNGDGINDYWQLMGIENGQDNFSQVYIYDRLGSLVYSMSTHTQGWDGNYQGKALPASDYWFRVVLQDGREYKSHFTLKR